MTHNGSGHPEDARPEDIAGTCLRKICTDTGLQEPGVSIVDQTESKKPQVNAEFTMRRRVPTIKVTRRAALELPADGLTFLLCHELGHLHGHHAWKIVKRWGIAGIALAFLVLLIGVAGLIVTSNSGESPIVPVAWAGAGMMLTVVAIAVYCNLSRREENSADRFAVSYQQHLVGAEQFFTARAAEAPEKEPAKPFWRVVDLMFRTHPYRSMRLASMRSHLERDHTPPKGPR